jgi:hypothetical protein
MKSRKLGFLLALGMALVWGGNAYAHHSFAATYFVDQTEKIEGPVREFLWRNPHSFIKVDAPDDKGVMQIWSIEWGGGAQLSQSRVTRDTVKAGDHVIITGNPGRDPEEHRLRMKSITRPSDGFKWEGVVQ